MRAGRFFASAWAPWRALFPRRVELDVDQLVQLADRAAEEEDWSGCFVFAREARQKAPTSSRLMELEAWACAMLGETQRALDLYGAAHNAGSTNAAHSAVLTALDAGDEDHAAVFLVLALDVAAIDTLAEIHVDQDLQRVAMRPEVAAAVARAHRRRTEK